MVHGGRGGKLNILFSEIEFGNDGGGWLMFQQCIRLVSVIIIFMGPRIAYLMCLGDFVKN